MGCAKQVRLLVMLRKMEEGGCKPDRVVYSVTIDHICMDGLLIEGLSLLLK